ncbi:hypothetical protein DEAC_c32130 [Desulfosporosinus acididurans]|uniref:Uncharacterized protein n=1 Tax=Desulfosporosinus acididurans TaxID=476652 RepID=A0A0J1FN33_9FIRM|nr:hypothetical protein DEAC_c32130 [Desulfosporosinus acididurans]
MLKRISFADMLKAAPQQGRLLVFFMSFLISIFMNPLQLEYNKVYDFLSAKF